MISWWFTNLPGRLGSLLTAGNEKGGGWWLYKWYGDMSGYMANVVPPNDKSDGVDAFAAVDEKQRYASIVLGGNSVGTVNVNIEGIPAFFGGEVEVLIEYVTWENKDKAVSGVQKISSEKYPISGQKLSIPVNVTNELYGYRLYITPTEQLPQEPFKGIIALPGTIEAENYDEGGSNNAYSDNEFENKGGEYREDGVDVVAIDNGFAVGYTEAGEWLEYTVNVEAEDDYALEARLASGSETSSFRLFLDDEAITDTIEVEKTGEDWDTYSTVSLPAVKLPKGEHVFKLLITGSYVNIDWLKFNVLSETPLLNQENPLIKKIKVQTVYDLRGNHVARSLSEVERPGVYIVRSTDGRVNKLVGIKK
jgi:hypothetical protein